jgi:hypothetical protein
LLASRNGIDPLPWTLSGPIRCLRWHPKRDSPLFVAEGSPDKKLEQIRRTAYLAYTLDKFKRSKNRLVFFGSALDTKDEHLRDAIAGMKELKALFISFNASASHRSTRICAIRKN